MEHSAAEEEIMDFGEVLKAYNNESQVKNITGLLESNPIELLSSGSSCSNEEATPP